MNVVSRNGSPKQIPLQQLPFANKAKPHYCCRSFGLFGYFRLVLHHGNEKKLFDFWNFWSRLNTPTAHCEAEAFPLFPSSANGIPRVYSTLRLLYSSHKLTHMFN